MTDHRSASYAPFAYRSFRWLIASILTTTFAVQMQALVVGWQVYELTRDPLTLGLVALAEIIPFIGVALHAGQIVDRADRRRVTLWAILVLCLCSGALMAYTVRPGLVHADRLWPIYATIFVSGIARSFLQPARTALAAEIVPREIYPSAVAWRSSVWQTAAVLGPAAGGFLYAFAGITTTYMVSAVLLALALGATWAILPEFRVGPPVAVAGESLMSGVRFIFAQPVLLGALTLDMFAVLFGGAVALLPVFAAEILHVGPEGLGLLRSAPAAGAVLMSLVIAHRPPMRHTGRALFVSVFLFGATMIAFALSRSFPLSLGLLAFSGMVDQVSVVIRSTLLTVLTPDRMLGRVSAVNSIFVGSSNEIGQFESGVAARLVGTVESVLLGGAMTIVVVVIAAWKFPRLRRLGEMPTSPEH